MAILSLGLLIALHVVVTNYQGERADFARKPPAEISQHPERVGVAGLREISFAVGGSSRIAGWAKVAEPVRLDAADAPGCR